MVIKLRTKILLSFALVVVILSAILATMISVSLKKSLTSQLLQRVEINTKSEAASLSDMVLSNDLDGIVNFIFNEKSSRKDMEDLFVYGRDSKLLASTEFEFSSDEDISDEYLIMGSGIHTINHKGEIIYQFIVPLPYETGYVVSNYYARQIDDYVRNVEKLIIEIGGIGMFIALVFAIFFSRYIFDPIRSLKDTMTGVAAGDLSKRAKVKTNDEIGFLARVFNQMLDNLNELYSDLEKKVKERTQQLSEKVGELTTQQQDLETLNRLMINRELRMAELKKEITELKKRADILDGSAEKPAEKL